MRHTHDHGYTFAHEHAHTDAERDANKHGHEHHHTDYEYSIAHTDTDCHEYNCTDPAHIEQYAKPDADAARCRDGNRHPDAISAEFDT